MNICSILGHNDKKYFVDGDGVHLDTCCIIRAQICERCDRWK
ncbi:hypothetical protein LCGC14_2054800 [marine sediment metagenome]|uniref:Uncharacterized protein n=1 Tax=marine sediment metagenome TaxID=412755 RepID=A0A0F9HJX8_9ZZZZ